MRSYQFGAYVAWPEDRYYFSGKKGGGQIQEIKRTIYLSKLLRRED